MAVRELVAHAVQLDRAEAKQPIHSSFFGPVLWYRERSATSGLPELRIHLTINEALLTNIVDAVACDAVERIRAWVPLAMVQHVFPEWLEKPITNLPVQAFREFLSLVRSIFVHSILLLYSFAHLQLLPLVAHLGHPAPQTQEPTCHTTRSEMPLM